MSRPSIVPSVDEFRLPKFDFEPWSTRSSVYSQGTTEDEKALIDFNKCVSESAEDWSPTKKLFAVSTCFLVVLNSAIASSLPGGAVSYTADYFHVTDEQQYGLPISVFLIGYVFGPLLFSPLSEMYGRRIIMIVSFIGYTAFTFGCAMAPTWPALLIFRFLVGLCAAAPYTLGGGICADLYSNAAHRGLAIMVLMIVLNVGPASGPIIAGFVSSVSWRRKYWVALILAGVSFIPLLFLPETYGPVLHARRARAARTWVGKSAKPTPLVSNKQSLTKTLSVAFIRPFRMFSEPIVLATSLLMAMVYAIFYLFFEAYPIIFGGVYQMSTGVSALAFIPMPIGACLDIIIVLWWERYLERAKARNAPWAFNEEYRRMPLACIGGPLCALSLFWLGWSARPTTHWIIPMLAGIPYGMGVEIIFMALTSYLSDGYGTLTASALASAAIMRSVLGALLPLLAQPMYGALGVGWASSLLGFMTLAMAVVPFLLLKFGGGLRRRSKLCRQVIEKKEALEGQV
ncbi:hypothetical protein HO173_008009 [Letharia columbiana]|uniref:Major facilitator superfamily (MFS) profile domain-containing protein n=1 Tax=Letharia columbiana TaxID=112416 RepID=A0A8H6L372_9LECA|nr:uncharacterized protein HO173_008009 [Letharia columbiana]KAF6233797.1 hypothetical protein HO173_008009 [Letharia columbiana]